MMRDPRWILRRLRLMSPGEIGARIRRTLQHAQDRIRHASRTPVKHSHAMRGTEFGPARFLVDLALRDTIRPTIIDRCGWTPQAAEDARAHRFTFFAFDRKWFGEQIRWNYEYHRGIATPMDFGPSLDYRDEQKVGDIKYAWEHNRHHHFVELAKASYLTGDLAYARELLAQLDSWIGQCPVPYGVNWASGLEIAIRLINWTVAIFFLEELEKSSSVVELGLRKRWLASVLEHLEFLADNLSSHSSANNHLIGEAAGLFIGGLCYKFPQAERWRSVGKSILEQEARAQIWPDGVDKEQAVGYQVFVFDFLMLAGLFGERNGVPFSPEYWRILESMAEFVAALIDGEGTLPRIGDEDDGYVVRFSFDPSFRLFRSLLTTAGCRFNRPDLLARGAADDEKTFWLLGELGAELDPVPSVAIPLARAFQDGGYYLVPGHEAHLLFDCGPLGYLSLAAHGHADALSVLLRYRDRWILIDPGTYAYHTQRQWRDYFRGTGAHNTILCDGLDQSVSGGNFLWTRKARCRLIHWEGHSVCGEHDGYARLDPPLVHQREATYVEARRAFRVVDRIRTTGGHNLRQSWHLAPGSGCQRTPRGWEIASGDVRVLLVPDAQFIEQVVCRGNIAPIGGWYSAGFDRKVPAPELACSGSVHGDAEFVTFIELL